MDQWSITAGVTDSEKLEIAHKWIDFRLERESMKTVAVEIGWAPTVDVRDMLSDRYVDTPLPQRDRGDSRPLPVRRALLA